jgi:hypothetical protein
MLCEVFCNDSILLKILPALVGAFSGWYLSYRTSKHLIKIQTTSKLHDQYFGEPFIKIRGKVYDIKKKWTEDNDRSVVNYYIMSKTIVKPIEERDVQTQVKEHGNLTILLNFYSSIVNYDQAGLIDRRFLRNSLRHAYMWQRSFFLDFIKEYKKKRREYNDKSQMPYWAIAIPKLDKILDVNNNDELKFIKSFES